MKVLDIADEIFRELSFPSDISISSISFWLRSNVGSLNNLISTSFAVNSSTLEFDADLTEQEKVILKKLYTIHYYDLKIRSTLGAAANDAILEVSSDGATVRKINKNEVSKTYASIKKQESEDLQKLVNGYKSSAATPLQVAGDDTIAGEGLSRGE
jgi:hypothetical protein